MVQNLPPIMLQGISPVLPDFTLFKNSLPKALIALVIMKGPTLLHIFHLWKKFSVQKKTSHYPSWRAQITRALAVIINYQDSSPGVAMPLKNCYINKL